MNEIIEVENYVDAQGVRRLHLMCNAEIRVDDLEPPYLLPDGVNAEVKREAGAWHLRAEWRAREAFAGTMRGSDRREWQVVLWALEKGDRIGAATQEATVLFRRAFGRHPQFAAVRRFPQGVDDLAEIEIDGGRRMLPLVESADVPERFVMVF
jgi:hypothetical protein